MDSHSLTLCTGKNGSGKSALNDALSFVLFGKPFRNFNKPQLLNSINQKQLLVELNFEVGKKKYKIIRGMKPNIFEIYENEKLINQDPNIRDYQKVLEQQIIKMNYRAFTQVVIMGSSSYIPFMRLKAQERRDFIEDLLDIRIFSIMNDLLKNKSKLIKDNIRDVDVEIKSLREKIEIQDKHVKSRKFEKQNRIDILNEEIDKLLNENSNNSTIINKTLIEVDFLNKEAEKFESASDRLTEFRTLHKKIKSSIEKHHEEKQFYHSIEECPICKQNVGSNHRTHIVESVDKSIQNLEIDLLDLQNKLESVNEDLIKYEELATEISTLNDIINQKNKLIIVNNALIEKNKVQLSIIIEDTTNLDEETKKLKEYAKAILKKSELKKSLLEIQQYQDTAIILLQDNGIKAKIVKQYIPIINKLVNKYLDAMDFFVGFTLDENFNEIIKSRHRDTFSYESFSDGQKRRIDMALLLTWREVAKSKNSINTNLIILDEADAPMDGTGADMLIDLYKASNIPNVIMISHKEGLSNSADRVLTFEMKNNFTMLKED